MSDTSSATFRAVADFSGLIKEANAGSNALDGMGKASEQVGPAAEASAKRGSSAWASMGKGILKVTKWIALGVAGIGAAVLGMAIKGGISRALNIEDAQAKLKGLGHSVQSVQKIMDSALASVKGTAFALDEAAATAAGAVASGVKKGNSLTQYLKTVADTAVIAGTSMGDMGAIINKVTTTGKAQMDNLNQLSERGIPIMQYLQKELGVTAEELRQMVKEGAIDSKTFMKALQNNLGGAALRSAETTRGAFANMQAAMSRFGAQLVGGSLPLVKQFFIEVGVFFDGLGDRIKPGIESMNKVLGDFSIEGWADKALAGIDVLLGKDFGGISGDLSKIGDAAKQVWAAMPDFVSVLNLGWKALVLLADNADLVVKALPFLAAGFLAVKAAQIGANAAAALSPALRLAEIAMTRRLVTSNVLLAESMAATTAAAVASAGGQAADTGAKATNTTATNVNNKAQTRGIAARLRAIPSMLALAASYIIGATGAGVAAGATGLLSTAVKGLGKAIYSIPIIGWILALATVVVGGLVLMYQKFEWFRNLVDGVFSGIMGIVSTVIDWFVANVWPPIKEGLDAIAKELEPLKQAFADAWQTIQQAVGDAIKSVQDAWNSLDPETIASVMSFLKGAFEGVKSYFGFLVGVIGPVIGVVVGLLGVFARQAGMVIGFLLKVGAAIINFFMTTILPVIQNVVDQVAGFIRILGTVIGFIGGIISGVIGVIASVIGVIASVIGSVIGFLSGPVSAAFQLLKTVVTTVFNAIKKVVTTAVNSVKAVLGTIGGIVAKVVGFFQQILAGIRAKMSAAIEFVRGIPGKITAALSGFGTLLLDKGRELIQGLINGITGMIDNVKGAMSSIAEAIKGFLPGSPVKEGPLVSWNRNATGRKLMEMLAKGILDGEDKVKAAVNRVADTIRKTKFKVGKGAAIEAVKGMQKQMLKIARQYKAANEALAEANKVYEDLLKARADMAARITEQISSTGNIATLGSALLERGKGFLTVARLQKNLDQAYQVALQFKENLATLSAKGLSSDLITQLVEQGIGTADQVAAMLAKASPEELKALSDRFGQIKGVAAATGNDVSTQLYSTGINAAKSLADGLLSQIKALEAAASKIAASIVKTIKKKLKIKSPSKVMTALGKFTGQGYEDGLFDAMDPKKMGNAIADAGLAFGNGISASAVLSPMITPPPLDPFIPSTGAAGAVVSPPQVVNRETNVTINNPAPEPASESLPNTMRSLKFQGSI